MLERSPFAVVLQTLSHRNPSRATCLPRAAAAAVEVLESRQLLSTTWFVSPGGSNFNPGTLSQPFRTIQHAAGVAQPGDTVNIRAGTYHETVTVPRSGASGAPITFQAYNGEKAVVDGADPITGWTKYSGSIYKAQLPWDLGLGKNQIFVDGQSMIEARWPNTTVLSHPKLATVQGGSAAFTYSHHTANVQAPEPAGEPNDTLPDRIASAYYGSAFDVPVSFTDGQTHRVELYMMDYDQQGRSQVVSATDNATGATLASTGVSNFAKGVYLIYNVSGSVTFHLKGTTAAGASLSAVFIDPSSAAPPTASKPNTARVVGMDTQTHGNWIGVYGAQGQYIAGGVHNIPSYAKVFSSGNYLQDPALLNSGSDWTGATLEIGAGQGWVIQHATVSGRVGDKLYYDLPNLAPGAVDIYGAIVGNKYFLTGKFAGLDSPTEWFRDSAGNLYLWDPAGDSPSLHNVEAKHRQFGFVVDNQSYINIKGVQLMACNISGINSNNVHVDKITDRYLSQFTNTGSGWVPDPASGIYFVGNNNSLTNSVLDSSAGNGIRADGNNNLIQNNIIRNIDYSGEDAGAVIVHGNSNVIDHNSLFDLGRDGIFISNSFLTQVTYNKITRFMIQTDDGGGIYSFGTNGYGSNIAFNDVSGAHSNGFGSAGVFLDNYCYDYSIHNNRLFDVDAALKLNPPSHREIVTHNNLIGSQFSVATGGDFDLTGSAFNFNLLVGLAQITPNSTQMGNVTSGDEAGSFVSGSTLPGGQG